MDKVNVMPTKAELMDAVIKALDSLGGSAKTSEIDAKVAETMNLSEELLALEDDNSTGTVYSYKMRWARTELKQKGVLTNPVRGIWAVVAKK
jgi:restriction endonuclease Mrr